MRTELPHRRMRRRIMLIAAALAATATLPPTTVSAEGLFDMLLGAFQKLQRPNSPLQANFVADPFGANQQPAPQLRSASGSGPAFCVRSCDGRYFPLTMRGGASPAQMCQAFCPASPTKIYLAATSMGRHRRVASAMRTAKTPSAIAKRCARTAPATAAIPPDWHRSISRWTLPCVRVT